MCITILLYNHKTAINVVVEKIYHGKGTFRKKKKKRFYSIKIK